jgi:hypothetical protein
MSKTILQINYHFDLTPDEHLDLCNHAAAAIAAVSGLVWKTWLVNEANHEGGGIYLFESRQQAEDYLSGPIITALGKHPAISKVSVKLFDTNEALDEITRAPVKLAIAS